METNNKKHGFDAVRFMREQREKLSLKLSAMTAEQIIEYFKQIRASQTAIKPCA